MDDRRRMAGLPCAGGSAYAGKKEEIACDEPGIIRFPLPHAGLEHGVTPPDLRRSLCEDKMSSVIDDYLVDPKISLLDKTRMQAQVLVPVLRAFRAELGKDKADAVVKQALRAWSKQLFAAIGDGIEGSPRRKWAAINSVFGEVSGKEVEVEILRHDKEALDIDVTRCRFAEFFRALGEPELGALLICEADFDIASVGEGEVSLDRAQTIMQGAPSCTFRYRFAPRE